MCIIVCIPPKTTIFWNFFSCIQEKFHLYHLQGCPSISMVSSSSSSFFLLLLIVPSKKTNFPMEHNDVLKSIMRNVVPPNNIIHPFTKKSASFNVHHGHGFFFFLFSILFFFFFFFTIHSVSSHTIHIEIHYFYKWLNQWLLPLVFSFFPFYLLFFFFFLHGLYIQIYIYVYKFICTYFANGIATLVTKFSLVNLAYRI